MLRARFSAYDPPMPTRLFLVIETFKEGDALPVYRRFRDRGRLMPDGIEYVSSWIDEPLGRCWQVMRAPDRALLDAWIANWSDPVDFEVVPVLTSDEARARVLPSL